MKSDEGVEQIECDIYCLPVAQAPLSGDEFIEWLPVNELGDEIPLADVGLVGPEDPHHVGMMDLAQGADLTAHRLIPGGAVEELERSFLLLDVIAHPVDLRKAALPDYVQDLEAVLDDVADGVAGSPGPNRGSHLCRVRFGEGPAAGRRCRGRRPGKVARLRSRARAYAAHTSGPGRVRPHMPDSTDGGHQARMQHVRVHLGREVKLLDVAHGVEPASPGLVDVPEQPVLP